MTPAVSVNPARIGSRLERVRLVHLADYGGPYPGSFIPMLRAILGAAQDRGWLPEAVFAEGARGRTWTSELAEDGVALRFLPAGSRREMRDGIRDLLSETSGPSILHTHFTSFDLPAVAAAVGRPQTAVFWHFHSPYGPPRLRVILQNVVKYSLAGRRVHAILCVGSHIADTARRRGAPRGKILVFPNGIDLDRFSLVRAEQRTAMRKELGLPTRATVLLHFGWDWERKGGDLFLEAVKILRGRGMKQLVALTVGESAAAHSLCEELGLQDVAIVRPATDQVQKLYGAADVFVSSSRAEGMPFSIAEALYSGVPVVATDIPGDVLKCSGLGAARIVPAAPFELAGAVSSLLARQPDAALQDALAAHTWVRERMDLRTWSRRLLALYQEALGPGDRLR